VSYTTFSFAAVTMEFLNACWVRAEEGLIGVEEAVGLRKGPLECLEQQPIIKVKELVRLAEGLSHQAGSVAPLVSGVEYEQNNIYKIFPAGGWDDIFYAKEDTHFMSRMISQFPVIRNCVPWQVDVAYCEGLGKQEFIKIQRPASCPCCCFCRPTANVTGADGGMLAKIVDPMQCGGICRGFYFEIKDTDNATLMKVRGGENTNPERKRRLTFNVFSAEDDRILGTINKKVGFNILHDDDVDTYLIQFLGDSKGDQRVLMMALTLFMDLQRFNGGIEICSKKKKRKPEQQQMLQEPLAN